MKPLLRVVLSVFAPWLTGVASPRTRGFMALKAVRLRRLCCRLSASLREAIEEVEKRMYVGKGKLEDAGAISDVVPLDFLAWMILRPIRYALT